MTTQLQIAVLGAGYVGGAVAREAAARGHVVWAVRRSAPAEGMNDSVRWLSGDLATETIEGLPARLDAVVLTVAPSRGADGYDDTYPPAAHAAVTIARERGARALVYTSSTGVYGGRDGAWMTEQSPRLGTGESNAALIAAEDILLGAPIPSVTVLRVAGIYGPGRDPRSRMRNAASLAQRGAYWTNLAQRDDIVDAIFHALQLPIGSRVLNVTDGAPTQAAEVARWLARAEGGDPDALQFGNESQRSRNDQRVSNAVLVATGWSPRYPSFREGFTSGI
jgi:nucleoside-diphosphate-sugar epimerase